MAEPIYSATSKAELFDKFFDGREAILPVTYEINYGDDNYVIFQKPFGGHSFVVVWIYRGDKVDNNSPDKDAYEYSQVAHLTTTTARVKIEFDPNKGIINLFDIAGDFLSSYSLEQLSSANITNNISENRVIEKEPEKYSWENWKKAFLEQF